MLTKAQSAYIIPIIKSEITRNEDFIAERPEDEMAIFHTHIGFLNEVIEQLEKDIL